MLTSDALHFNVCT